MLSDEGEKREAENNPTTDFKVIAGNHSMERIVGRQNQDEEKIHKFLGKNKQKGTSADQ